MNWEDIERLAFKPATPISEFLQILANLGRFPQFLKLPLELQYMIWEYTWGPREVTIVPKKRAGFWTLCGTRLPASGYVNRVARREALRHYALRFAPQGWPAVYFDFKLDTLRIPSHIQALSYLGLSDLQRVESLMIPEWIPASPPRRPWPGTELENIVNLMTRPYTLLGEPDPIHRHLMTIRNIITINFKSLRKVTVLPFRTCQGSGCHECWRCHTELNEEEIKMKACTRTIQIPPRPYEWGHSIEITFPHYIGWANDPVQVRLCERDIAYLALSLEAAFGDDGQLSDQVEEFRSPRWGRVR
ncbi:hypothetical protein F5Y06DRAFT_153167 [Hypoxylon sp. FL0890]|nr:hypothetical protein F5Y06DRAFT_153167 [Hypoxylon sp. FL0890]